MRSWVAFRLTCAFVLGWALLGLLSACGARGDIEGFGGAGGAGGGSGTCHAEGESCAGDASCCSDLVCKSGVCKPTQICEPDGKACQLTGDCCAFDCINGFCGGIQCKPPG